MVNVLFNLKIVWQEVFINHILKWTWILISLQHREIALWHYVIVLRMFCAVTIIIVWQWRYSKRIAKFLFFFLSYRILSLANIKSYYALKITWKEKFKLDIKLDVLQIHDLPSISLVFKLLNENAAIWYYYFFFPLVTLAKRFLANNGRGCWLALRLSRFCCVWKAIVSFWQEEITTIQYLPATIYYILLESRYGFLMVLSKLSLTVFDDRVPKNLKYSKIALITSVEIEVRPLATLVVSFFRPVAMKRMQR